MCVNTVDGVAKVLLQGDQDGRGDHEGDGELVAQPEDGRVDLDLLELEHAFQAGQSSQHGGFLFTPRLGGLSGIGNSNLTFFTRIS